MQAGINNAALASVGVQVMNVLMTVVAASLMDRAGRKQLLTISFRSASASVHDNTSSMLYSLTYPLALIPHAAVATQHMQPPMVAADGQLSMPLKGREEGLWEQNGIL